MRKVAAFVCLLLIVVTAYAQQWYSTTVPRSRVINSAAILSPDNIVVAGGNQSNDSLQALFRTSDKGVNWDFNPTDNISSWIRSIDFIDTSTGFGVGFNSKVVYTTNGGRLWNFASPPPVKRHLNKVLYINANTLFAAGGEPDSLATILKSTNAGQSWAVVLDTAGTWLKGLYFFDSQKGIAVGDKGKILMTNNGGTNWAQIVSPVQRDFNAVTFINSDTGFIIGGRQDTVFVRTILRTTNGGLNWSVVKDETGGRLNDLFFANASTGYAVGDSTGFLKTTDGGNTWALQAIPNATPADRFNTIRFDDSGLGVIGTRGGTVFIYTNSQLPQVATLNAVPIDSSNVNLQASINPHGESCNYTFYFSTDASFSTTSSTYPQNLKTDSTTVAVVSAGSFNPGSTYYYYIAATTLAGTVYGDTLSFVMQPATYKMQLFGAMVNSATTATFSGQVQNMSPNTSLFFEYGINGNFNQTVVATPAGVNDTATHQVTANVTGLVPYANYVVRLKAVAAGNNYYSNTGSFYTHSFNNDLGVLPATNVSMFGATINGSVANVHIPISVSFEYGTTINFGQTAVAVPSQINDTLYHAVSAAILNLKPFTTYYYRLKANTPVGIYYSNSSIFTTGTDSGNFRAMAATLVTENSAKLNGFISGVTVNTTLHFDYGITPGLGTQAQTTPSVISDTASYKPSAILTGLQPNTVYYFCLVAQMDTFLVRSDTMQVYTGTNEIPNWDFQVWNIDTVLLPPGWNLHNANVERVTGHVGNYAVRLYGNNFALVGIPGDDGFIGGQAFTDRPDSITFYLNYGIDAGDSAAVLVALLKGPNVVSNSIYRIGGNSNGSFRRFSFPIEYQSGLTPDSLVIGFVTTNPDKSSSHPNNFIVIDEVKFVPNATPVVNFGFENWVDYALQEPMGWYTGAIFLGSAPNDRIISRVLNEPPDDYAVEYRNVISNGRVIEMQFNNRDEVLSDGSKGSPVFARHKTFNGYYRFFPVDGDTLSMRINITSGGIPIAYGEFRTTDSVVDFTPFEIPLVPYSQSTQALPDTADISFAIYPAPGSRALSRMNLDKLHFDGFVSVEDDKLLYAGNGADGLKLYPNPTTGQIILEEAGAANNNAVVQLFNLNGQVVYQIRLAPGQKKAVIDIENPQPGFYLLRYTAGDKTINRKIVIKE